jgi:hypothetical protein
LPKQHISYSNPKNYLDSFISLYDELIGHGLALGNPERWWWRGQQDEQRGALARKRRRNADIVFHPVTIFRLSGWILSKQYMAVRYCTQLFLESKMRWFKCFSIMVQISKEETFP